MSGAGHAGTIAELSVIDNHATRNRLSVDEPAPRDVFQTRLRTARVRLRGVSQAELGAATGLPATSIAHFEQGTRKPSFDNLRKLATALEVSVDYLMGRVETPRMDPAPGALERYADQLSERDRALAEDFLRLLADRERRERD